MPLSPRSASQHERGKIAGSSLTTNDFTPSHTGEESFSSPIDTVIREVRGGIEWETRREKDGVCSRSIIRVVIKFPEGDNLSVEIDGYWKIIEDEDGSERMRVPGGRFS